MEGLRQSARGTTGKVIIVIAVVAFVFLGSIAVLGNLSFGSIKVNGVKITPVELNMATNSIKNVYRQMGLSDEQASQIAIGELVNSKAFSTTIDEMGVISSNELVESKIKEDPNFSLNGEFDLNSFESTLRSNYITVEQYKGFAAEAFNKEQFQQGVFATDFISLTEASKLYALENQTRTFESITIKQADFISLVEVPTQESIQLYFDTNRTNFMTNESTVVDYITIDTTQLITDINVTQEEIDSEYALYVEEQNAKARKTVSHILISTDDRSSEEAKSIAEEAILKIQAGEEFASVVSLYSDDIGSKEIGGFFGEISTDSVGDIDFKLGVSTLSQVGEISAPVQTQFGYHVIRLDALHELEVLSLADKKI
ncbi:MAG: SurA N-terminal domain-containing protein [Saccharospirillaceae bacterium]|nr:SurA N-terminal domain-containing protein [Pseudomonadales bacterium]NRB80291.1 SurA N-terminal domain-containing protein [Saccharospirillaceae bacterium]